jgi:hypothetical protein
LQEIQPAAPAELVAQMIGKKLSRQTIAATVSLLGSILQKAAEEQDMRRR